MCMRMILLCMAVISFRHCLSREHRLVASVQVMIRAGFCGMGRFVGIPGYFINSPGARGGGLFVGWQYLQYCNIGRLTFTELAHTCVTHGSSKTRTGSSVLLQVFGHRQ